MQPILSHFFLAVPGKGGEVLRILTRVAGFDIFTKSHKVMKVMLQIREEF
jgi:hypothetical protein